MCHFMYMTAVCFRLTRFQESHNIALSISPHGCGHRRLAGGIHRAHNVFLHFALVEASSKPVFAHSTCHF